MNDKMSSITQQQYLEALTRLGQGTLRERFKIYGLAAIYSGDPAVLISVPGDLWRIVQDLIK